MRIQAKRRPPSRRHLHETTDTVPSSEDNDNAALIQSAGDTTASLQTTQDTVDSSQRADIGHGVPVSLPPVTVTRESRDLHYKVSVSSNITDISSSVTVRGLAHSTAATLSAGNVADAVPPVSSATAVSADNVVDAVTAAVTPAVSNTQLPKPSSPDVDDIFADSSLFVAGKLVLCLCPVFLAPV